MTKPASRIRAAIRRVEVPLRPASPFLRPPPTIRAHALLERFPAHADELNTFYATANGVLVGMRDFNVGHIYSIEESLEAYAIEFASYTASRAMLLPIRADGVSGDSDCLVLGVENRKRERGLLGPRDRRAPSLSAWQFPCELPRECGVTTWCTNICHRETSTPKQSRPNSIAGLGSALPSDNTLGRSTPHGWQSAIPRSGICSKSPFMRRVAFAEQEVVARSRPNKPLKLTAERVRAMEPGWWSGFPGVGRPW